MAESEVVSSYSWNLCGSYRRREFLFMYFQFNFYSIYWNFKNRTLYKGSVFCFPFSCDKTGGSFMKLNGTIYHLEQPVILLDLLNEY